jgi:hypothetical protein
MNAQTNNNRNAGEKLKMPGLNRFEETTKQVMATSTEKRRIL